MSSILVWKCFYPYLNSEWQPHGQGKALIGWRFSSLSSLNISFHSFLLVRSYVMWLLCGFCGFVSEVLFFSCHFEKSVSLVLAALMLLWVYFVWCSEGLQSCTQVPLSDWGSSWLLSLPLRVLPLSLVPLFPVWLWFRDTSLATHYFLDFCCLFHSMMSSVLVPSTLDSVSGSQFCCCDSLPYSLNSN